MTIVTLFAVFLAAVPSAGATAFTFDTEDFQVSAQIIKEGVGHVDDLAKMRAPAGLADTLKAAEPNKGNRQAWDYSYIADATARTFMETLDSKAQQLAEHGYSFSRAVFKAARNTELLRQQLEDLPSHTRIDPQLTMAVQKYNDARDAFEVSLAGLGADRFVEAFVHDIIRQYYLIDPVGGSQPSPLADRGPLVDSGAAAAAAVAHAAAVKLAAERAAAVASGAPLTVTDLNTMVGWMNRRTHAANQPYCYKQTETRGAGYPLSTCDSTMEKNGALCYPKCKDGYGGAGPVCWQRCPSGYVDTGAFCHVDKALTKSGSWSCPEWYSCRKVCPAGYTNAGLFCALTTPSNPSGWKGDGLDLIKDSYGRGAGYVMSCTADQEKDGALCYPKCKAGYKGVGPVCWQTCGADKVECGVGCANSKASCGTSTANMVIAPLMLAANILTLGGSSEVEAAQAEIKTAIKAGEKEAAKAAFARMMETYADNLAKLTTEDVARQMEAKLAKSTARWVTKEYAKIQYYLKMKSEDGPTADSLARDLAGLDPTGVAQVIEAYTQPKCAADEPMPAVSPL